MKKYIMDREGNVREEADLLAWAEWFETADRSVARTEIIGEETGEVVTVSTVFLGIDHDFSGGGPVVFETMVFGGKHDDEMDRYCTAEEAKAGHAAMVERVRGGQI